MKFFIPGAQNDEHAEELWQGARQHAAAASGLSYPVTDRRVKRLTYWHERPEKWVAEVGEDEGRTGKQVMIIFETDGGPYLVCTTGQGMVPGGWPPMMVGESSIDTVEYFDGFDFPDDR